MQKWKYDAHNAVETGGSDLRLGVVSVVCREGGSGLQERAGWEGVKCSVSENRRMNV